MSQFTEVGSRRGGFSERLTDEANDLHSKLARMGVGDKRAEGAERALQSKITPLCSSRETRPRKGLQNLKSKFPLPLTPYPLPLFLALGITLVSTLPAQALQVRVTPSKPQLGDTLSVVVRPDDSAVSDSPTVMVNRKTYPAFAISPGVFRAFIPTTPLQKVGRREIRVSSEGRVRNIAVWVANRKFPVQRITLRGGKAGLEATQLELSRVAAFKSLVTPQQFWNGPFLKPNRGRISTLYGVRRYYNGKFAKDYYHRGVDYAGPVGSPVIAPAAGRVSLVGLESQGFRVHGNIVGIDHGQGVTSVFLHLSRIYVREGDIVRAGQPIGAVGSTGASTGPHLHWGFYIQGESVDPSAWREQRMN